MEVIETVEKSSDIDIEIENVIKVEVNVDCNGEVLLAEDGDDVFSTNTHDVVVKIEDLQDAGTTQVVQVSEETFELITVVEKDTNGHDGTEIDTYEEEEDRRENDDEEYIDEKIDVRDSGIETKIFSCKHCKIYSTTKKYLLLRHIKTHSEDRPFLCSICSKGFKTAHALQNHVNTHMGTKPHNCRLCDMSFTTSGELVRHVRYKHTREKPHKCKECDYSSVESSKLKRHMRCHTGEDQLHCPRCTFSTPNKVKLRRHLKSHNGERPYECEICNARFAKASTLRGHKVTHLTNKPIFQCEMCPTTCGRMTDLRYHIKKQHTASEPLKCGMCNSLFPDKYSLKAHKKSHEGEKCFKCNLCPYSSTTQRHLESHLFLHTGQKPFQCGSCNQSFRQKQLLKRHQNIYHNPEYVQPKPQEKTHECPECSKTFRHKGNLLRHLSHHDPDPAARQHMSALKQGRKRRLVLTKGSQNVLPVLITEEETNCEVMTVEGIEGDDFVILKVYNENSEDPKE